jgi:hypothetical protein
MNNDRITIKTDTTIFLGYEGVGIKIHNKSGIRFEGAPARYIAKSTSRTIDRLTDNHISRQNEKHKQKQIAKRK